MITPLPMILCTRTSLLVLEVVSWYGEDIITHNPLLMFDNFFVLDVEIGLNECNRWRYVSVHM
jgi:hypothetical protein